MNIEFKVIQKFKNYLKELNDLSANGQEKYNLNSSNIFSQYSEEFQEFLSNNYDIDYSSLFSENGDKNLFSNIKYENGKFVSSSQDFDEAETMAEILNAISQEEQFADVFDVDFDGDVSDDEYNSMLLNLQTDNSQGLIDVLDNINAMDLYFNDKSNIKLYDEDGDGVLSAREKNNAKQMISIIGGANGILTDKNINMFTKIFDLDGDGNLSNEEYDITKSFLNTINNKFSEDELSEIQNYMNTMLNNSDFKIENFASYLRSFGGDFSDITLDDFANISAGINTNDIMELNGAGSQESFDDYQRRNGQTSTRGSSSLAYEDKNVNNMNIEQLEQELSNAKNNANTALNDYENALNEIDTTKAKELNDIQNKISEIEVNLVEIDNFITSQTTVISNLESNILNYQNLIASEKSKENPDKSIISSYEQKIAELERQKDAINNEIISYEQQKNELNESLEIQNSNLNSKIEEISTLYPQLAELKEKYDKALNYVSQVEQTLAQRKEDKEKTENTDKESLEYGSKNYKNNSDDYTNLPLTYTLDGKEYHCVGFEGYDTDNDGQIDFQLESWEEAQRYLANGGVRNIGQYGTMQCHNYSAVVCDLALGTLNLDLANALVEETENPEYGDRDTAGKMGTLIGDGDGKYNTRAYAQCKVSGREEQIEIIKNELQNGRPCLVSVPYSSGQHWVSAIGMSKDGDVLIWDSYDGSIQRLGTKSGEERRVIASSNGVMVATPGHTFKYNSGEYINYWDEYVDNSMSDVVSVLNSRKK